MSLRSIVFPAVLAAVAIVAVAVGQVMKGGATPKPLSLQDPVAFVVQADKLLDKIGPVKADPSLLEAWAAEIRPWFAETGIASQPVEASAQWEYFRGTDAYHVLGYTYCDDYAHINSRYLNPADTSYADPEWVFTLAHELAHLQQGAEQCRAFDTADIENSAQLAAVEVMSAIALTGNKVAEVALLQELEYMAVGYLRYQAWGDHAKTAKLYSLLRHIWTPQQLAQRNLNYRFWRTNTAELRGILFRYSYLPFKRMMRGERSGHIDGLVLGGPQTWTFITLSDPTNFGADSMKQRLYVDDLIQFLRRASSLQ